MKKVLSITLLMLCISIANAQSLSIIINNNALANGDTVSIKAEGEEDVLPTGEPYYVAELRPTFHNSSPAINSKCRIIMNKLNDSPSFVESVCTSLCVDDTISVPFTINMNSDYVGAYIHFAVPVDAEMGLFKMTVYDTNNADNYAFCFVKVYNNTVGIDQPAGNAMLNAWPNPASTAVRISYTIDSEAGELVVTDIMGRTVTSLPLSRGENATTLDVSKLPNGVYLYGIREHGVLTATKKLIVR